MSEFWRDAVGWTAGSVLGTALGCLLGGGMVHSDKIRARKYMEMEQAAQKEREECVQTKTVQQCAFIQNGRLED